MRRDFDALPAEYSAAMPGEQFAKAISTTCPEALSQQNGLDGMEGITRLSGIPSFLEAYPATTWYSLDSAPRNVFLSFDAVPNARRCRTVLANNVMPGAAHLWATGALQAKGASVIDEPKMEPRRNLLESVWARALEENKTMMFLVQSVPQPENGGRGWQATAIAAVLEK